jgi:hypothetical protein
VAPARGGRRSPGKQGFAGSKSSVTKSGATETVGIGTQKASNPSTTELPPETDTEGADAIEEADANSAARGETRGLE